MGVQIPNIYVIRKAPWREVAHYVALIPDPVVLNTRSQSIQSPYFEDLGVPVEKWDPDSQGVKRLEDLLALNKNVFIVENFWGGLTYWKDLKAYLSKKNYLINETNFGTGEAEQLMLIQLRQPKN